MVPTWWLNPTPNPTWSLLFELDWFLELPWSRLEISYLEEWKYPNPVRPDLYTPLHINFFFGGGGGGGWGGFVLEKIQKNIDQLW